MFLRSSGRARGAAALCALTAIVAVSAGRGVAQNLRVSRANLANAAAFDVTTTTAPKSGPKASQTMRVEVKGNKARVEYNNPQTGPVTYLANEKGLFFYIPANKIAQKQSFQGGADAALDLAFRQVNDRLKTAKKTGAGTVSGQPVDIYKDAETGALLYVGRKPGFRLPVKMVLSNEGGTRTFLVSNIKTNVALPDARFAVPAGVRIIEASGAAGGPGRPGVPGAGR